MPPMACCGDFSESPVTSVSPGGKENAFGQRSLGAMQIAHVFPARRQYKMRSNNQASAVLAGFTALDFFPLAQLVL